MIIFVVGPSGVGKSTALSELQPMFSEMVFLNLDGITAEWAAEIGLIETASITDLNACIGDPELFFALGFQAIGVHASRHSGKHLVIDVGAGFQTSSSAGRLHLHFKIISIVSSPEAAYQRIRERKDSKENRTLVEYCKDEFNDRRQAIYDQAHVKIQTDGQPPSETADSIASILRGLTHGD